MHPSDERLNRPGGLSERLFRMRKAAGLTGDQMAVSLGWPRSKISKIENGRQMPSAEDVRVWAREVGHPEAAEDLVDMLTDAQAIHRQWRRQLRQSQASIQEDLDRQTREAAHVREVQILLIPGLLQTAGYARSLMTEIAGVYGISSEGAEASVAARIRRQEVLYDSAKRFELITTEAALRTLVCPPQVMLGQLDRLLSLGLDNVMFGVIPMGIELPMTPLHGFLMLDDRVIVETYGSEVEPGDGASAAYGKIFDSLLAESVTGDDARRLIISAAADLRERGSAAGLGSRYDFAPSAHNARGSRTIHQREH